MNKEEILVSSEMIGYANTKIIQNIKENIQKSALECLTKKFHSDILQDKLKEYIGRDLIEATDNNIGDFIVKRSKLPRKLKKKNKKNKVFNLDVICKQSVEYIDVVVSI